MTTPELRRILNAIDELESNGVATRELAMAGLCLSLCQNCEHWTGSGCPTVSHRPDEFAAWLVDRTNFCQEWDRLQKH